MQFNQSGGPRHTGKERYSEAFRLGGEEVDSGMYDVQGAYVQFMIRPRFLHLVWERDLGGTWRPVSAYRGGSKISGPRVMTSGKLSEKQDSHVEVWASVYTAEVSSYAASLPGLKALLDAVASRLP